MSIAEAQLQRRDGSGGPSAFALLQSVAQTLAAQTASGGGGAAPPAALHAVADGGPAQGVALSLVSDATLEGALGLLSRFGGCIWVGDFPPAAPPVPPPEALPMMSLGGAVAAGAGDAPPMRVGGGRKGALATGAARSSPGHGTGDDRPVREPQPAPAAGGRELRGTDPGFVRQTGDSIALVLSFNPPTVQVVGDATAEMLDRLRDAVVAECVGPERAAILKRKPTFERLAIPIYNWMAQMPHPVHEMCIRDLHFDEAAQCALMLCVMDNWSALPGWEPYFCDGVVAVDQTTTEEAKLNQRRMLTYGQNKPEKGQQKYKVTFELLYVYRP